MYPNISEIATGGALAQVFSCEFCEIFKNTFFIEHLWTNVSVLYNFRVANILDYHRNREKGYTFSYEKTIFCTSVLNIMLEIRLRFS